LINEHLLKFDVVVHIKLEGFELFFQVELLPVGATLTRSTIVVVHYLVFHLQICLEADSDPVLVRDLPSRHLDGVPERLVERLRVLPDNVPLPSFVVGDVGFHLE